MKTGEVRSRNRRVKKIVQRTWRAWRLSQFQHSTRFAAAAKSYRLVYEVTQSEVAKAYNVTTATVCFWESGKYFGWNQPDLEEFQRTIRLIAKN